MILDYYKCEKCGKDICLKETNYIPPKYCDVCDIVEEKTPIISIRRDVYKKILNRLKK